MNDHIIAEPSFEQAVRKGAYTQKELFEAINELRETKNAVILAHYYQVPEIQEIADFTGDSLGLSQKAAQTEADIIAFAGVHFMAETAKVLSPDKKVVLPDLKAGCSLADSCPPGPFKEFVDAHPDHTVVTYVNCSADIKALSDVVCTSTNAKAIIESIPEDKPIIFAPDKNLGNYLIRETGREMLLWDGVCQVHEVFSAEKLKDLMGEHPDAEVMAHPECNHLIRTFADFIGSTGKMLKQAQASNAQKFIVITEPGLMHEMEKNNPEKKFIPAAPIFETSCACSECEFMKMNTLPKLYYCLKHESPEINLDQTLIEQAYQPIQKMLDISKKAGL